MKPIDTLVPKLRLGTHLGAKLCFAGGGVLRASTRVATRGHTLHAKCNFAQSCVPKRSLGTRGESPRDQDHGLESPCHIYRRMIRTIRNSFARKSSQ